VAFTFSGVDETNISLELDGFLDATVDGGGYSAAAFNIHVLYGTGNQPFENVLDEIFLSAVTDNTELDGDLFRIPEELVPEIETEIDLADFIASPLEDYWVVAEIRTAAFSVPEPSTSILLGLGLAVLSKLKLHFPRRRKMRSDLELLGAT